MADETFTDVELDGAGPFVTPLLARFVGMTPHDNQEGRYALARFAFEDGAELLLPISIQAAEDLVAAAQAWRLLRDEADAKNEPRH